MSEETFEEWFKKHLGGEYILRSRRVMLESCWNHQQKKIQDLEAKLAKAVEALRFYAEDAYAWIQVSPNPDCPGAYISIEKDAGARARKTLEELEKGE